MRKLIDSVLSHKLAVTLAWVLLAAVGIGTVGTTTSRLTASFALPGQPGYVTNSQIARDYGNGGEQEVTIATLTLPAGQTTASPGVAGSIDRAFVAAATSPGHLRLLDAANAGASSPRFATRDGRTAYAAIFTPTIGGNNQPDPTSGITARLAAATPSGWTSGVTGVVQLTSAGSSSGGAGLLLEIGFGALGALLVLSFVFASFLAVVPLLMAAAAIPTTFLLVLALTGITDVSTVVQFLIGLIGLGVAIDYSLLVVSRWRELRANGADNDSAVRQAMLTAGRSVVLSGVTVAISLLALAALPVPYLRSIGFAGFFIPLVSVAVAVTLLPVLLTTIGPRLDVPRLRHEAGASRPWTGWARLIVRNRYVAALTGMVAIAVLVTPFFSLRIGSPTTASLAQKGEAHAALVRLTSAGVPSGVTTPIEVLVRPGTAPALSARLASIPGVWAATAPTGASYQRAGSAIVDVLPASETSTPAGRQTLHQITTIAATNHSVLGVGGTGIEDVDFSHAVYGNFPVVLAIIALVTLIILTRALRSVALAVKAIVLNVISVGAAYGIMVYVWQQGHGSLAIWGVPATGSITIWVPVAVFAFLFGLSMDYEVFILTRMREAYDDTGSTTDAIVTGIGRTGRLVTSAALILFLAFVSLASGPEVNIKILATGLGAGILVDAVIIRNVLVPAFVSLLGKWNWYLPSWAAQGLRVTAASASKSTDQSKVGAGA